jgi:hypothetical protein
MEGKIQGQMEVTRRRKMLLDLKEEALDRIKWRNRFGRGCGLVVRQISDDDDTVAFVAHYRPQ